MTNEQIALFVAAYVVVAWAPRVWWALVGLPRFRVRCDLYLTHVDYATNAGGPRCECGHCVAFRREMGWSP